MITIKRKRDIVSGAALKYKVWIDGEVATKLSYGEVQTLSLPKGTGTVQVTNLNGKSNSLDVQDGDSIEISHSSLNLWVFLALFIFGLVLQALEVSFFLVTLPIALIFYIIVTRMLKLTILEKVGTKSPH
ncbi:hypothetical protein [Alkalibacterium pelagium]|uniref:Uncharacterized protein n=1 Tax=Alkalibacterium pelagium TaxID=426702 RepID=A0A1H7JFG3_9LACT|nr:hypothetical protein [Alkalibacterium pelagium]GEN50190.1 hypothetical protein APE02nite_08550 [Alkalibacterium pelagium]SEK72135.1 hypothetical protein SAMN04488099_105136 [Alkalibacterium pelagium]